MPRRDVNEALGTHLRDDLAKVIGNSDVPCRTLRACELQRGLVERLFISIGVCLDQTLENVALHDATRMRGWISLRSRSTFAVS